VEPAPREDMALIRNLASRFLKLRVFVPYKTSRKSYSLGQEDHMKLYEYVSGKQVVVNELFSRYLAEDPDSAFVLKDTLWVLFSYCLMWFSNCSYVCVCCLMVHYTFFYRRYMALLHDYTHNPERTFRYKSAILSHLLIYGLLGHAHGIYGALYSIRHKLVHHKGRNAWGVDTCSTQRFQRDSFYQFVFGYWLRRYAPFISSAEVVAACLKKRRYKIAACHALSVALAWGFAWALYSLGRRAVAVWALAAPAFVSSFCEAYVEWVRRMFLNHSRPDKWFTYDTINNATSSQNPRNHAFQNVLYTLTLRDWRHIPDGFMYLCSQYETDQVLILQYLNDIQVGTLVFSGNLELLADYVVTTRPGGSTAKECAAYLKRQLEPLCSLPKIQ